MNLNDLNSFSNSTEESRNVQARTTVLDRVRAMELFYNKIVLYTEKYLKASNQEDEMAYCDSVTVGFNNYVQIFMDLIEIIQLNSKDCAFLSDKLISYINYYKRMFDDMSFDEKIMIDFLIRRNDLIHQYMNYQELTVSVINKFIPHSIGLKTIIDRLQVKLKRDGLLDLIID